MKIAYLCADFGVPIFGFKGASVHVREVVAAWQRIGHEVVVFSPSVERPANGTGEITAVAVEHIPAFHQVSQELQALDHFLGMKTRVRYDLRNLWYNLVLFDAVEPRLRAEQFDFVYERYTLFNYAGVALARRLGLPHILEVNAPLCYEQEKMRGLDIKNLAHELERRIFKESDRLAVVSEQLRAFAENRGVPRERILVIPNGVNPRTFSPDPASRERMRRQLRLEGKIVIGFVGSLKPWHGTESLVDAFSRIQPGGSEVHLLVVGDGPQRRPLKAQVREAGLASCVTFTGSIPHDQVPAYIAAMDIAVAPYIPHDNFYFSPIKLFEYMAVGKPVVAGGLGQVREVVHHGETGLLYEPGHVTQLRGALEELIARPDLRARLGKTGRDWVVRHRTWDSNAERILQAAQEVIFEAQTEAL